MADFEAVSCSNAWVYLNWEVPAGVTRYHIFRTDMTAGTPEAQIFDSHGHGGPAGRRAGPTMVAPGTPLGPTPPARFDYARFFPATFDVDGNYTYRLLKRSGAAGTPLDVIPRAQATLQINPALDGLLVGWRPQYTAAGPKPLWLEMANRAASPRRGWELLAAFDEGDADNVRMPFRQLGYYIDQIGAATPAAAGVRLKYRLQINVGATVTNREIELDHAWQHPEKLAFFLDSSDFRDQWIYYDGTNVLPYFDHYARVTAHTATVVCVATRYDHPDLATPPKAHYYLTRADDTRQWDRIIPRAEAADGLLDTVRANFGGHFVTGGIAELTALVVPQDPVGYAWGTVDAEDSPTDGTGQVGNRRALIYLTPYSPSMVDEPQLTKKIRGTFSHEYMHLNYHRSFHARVGSHWTAEYNRDNSVNEGSGFWAEDVVDSFSAVFGLPRLEAQRRWENLFLYYGWPNDVSFFLYARGLAWVMYNANRLRDRAGLSGHTYANVPRAWAPPGTPAAGFAPFFREFQLVMLMNDVMPDDDVLALKGYTAPTAGATPDELAASLKRTNSAGPHAGDHVLNTDLLRNWSIPPHTFAHGKRTEAPLPRRLLVAADLNGRAAAFFDKRMEVRHASAYFAAFEPPTDAMRGTLHVELRVNGGNPAQVRRVMAVARRVGDGSGTPAWEYYDAAGAAATLLRLPDYGERVDRVLVVVPTEHEVPVGVANLAAAPRTTLAWTYYVTPPPAVQTLGVTPRDAWRGGDNVILMPDDGSGTEADPISYVGPGLLQPWAVFNQGMDEGRKFHAIFADASELELTRHGWERCARAADTWRGDDKQLAAAGARDGEVVRFEIGRSTRAGRTITDGVRNFAGAYLDLREDRVPDADLVPDRRWRAILDTVPPDIDSVDYQNGDGASGTMADGINLVGVVKLDITVSDGTSGVAAIEVMARRHASPHNYSVGRKVLEPDPVDGKLANNVTETFFWNTSAADNGPVDVEILVSDRVGNVTRQTFHGAVVRNPRPGAAVVSGSLAAAAGARPTLAVTTSESDGATGAFGALLAGDPARGVLRFQLDGTASTTNAQIIIKARTPTATAPEEIWSEWLAAGGAVSKQWQVDGRALPDGPVTFSFSLKDESGAESPAATFAFICANRPPRIVPLQPRVTTRGGIDVWCTVDDRCAPAKSPGACSVRWAVGTTHVDRDLAAYPGGSMLRRAAIQPPHAGAGGWPSGPGELRHRASGVPGAAPPLPLLVLHALGEFAPLPERVVRLTLGTAGEPTAFFEVTCAAEHAVLVEGPNTKVRFRVVSEAPVQAADVTVTFDADTGEGDVTLGAVTAEAGGELTATAATADGKSGKGVLTIHAADTLGNEADLELPLWVVKEALAAPEDLRVRFNATTFADDNTAPEVIGVRVTGADASPIYIPADLSVDAVLGAVGHHLARIEVLFVPDAGAEVSLGDMHPSATLKDAFEIDKALQMGLADGPGKIVLRLVDHYGNDARQELAGFEVDGTAPAVGILTAATPGGAVEIELSPAPSDAGSGLEKTVLKLARTDTVPHGASPRRTTWEYLRRWTGGNVTLDVPITPGSYTATVYVMDKAGNRLTPDVTRVITVT